MKRMKRIFAMMLAIAMVLGMSLTGFAAETKTATGKEDDTATITVKGIADDAKREDVKAYQIIKAKYEGVGDIFSGYALVESLKNVTDVAVDFEETDKSVEEQIATIEYLNKVVEQTKTGGALAGAAIDATALAGGTATFEDLSVGSYLIMIAGTDTHTYNPIIASIYYNVKDNANIMEMEEVSLSVDEPWAKKSDSPNVDKKIVNPIDTEDDEDAEEIPEKEKGDNKNTVNIGDIIDYKITISPIPEYQGDYPKLKVVDTMDGGLKLVANTIAVTIENDTTGESTPLNVDEHYTLTSSEKGFTIDFVLGKNDTYKNGYTLNQYAENGNYVKIAYQGELTSEGVKYAQEANENNAKLEYTKDSKIEQDPENPDKKEKKTYTYTFDIDGTITKKIVTKTTEEETTPLGEATFGLFTDEDATVPYKQGETEIRAKSGSDGQLNFSGLAAGIYYLKELEAPEDYSLNTNIYKITIGETKYDADGKITEWQIKVDDQTGKDTSVKTNTFIVTYPENGTHVTLNGEIVVDLGTTVVDYDSTHANETTIKNTKLTNLPSTGGIGTTIFTIVGCLIMVAAAGLFFASRRKSEK